MLHPKDKDIYIKQSDKNIVVFIHGIFGSHTQFHSMIEAFKKQNYSIYAISLLGHGQNVKAFKGVKHTDWQKQVDNVFEMLTPQYENIYVISHSMGTLLTINTEYDYKIRKTVLWAPALKVKTSFRQMVLGLAAGSSNSKDEYIKKYQDITGVYFENFLQKVLTLPPTIELFKMIKKAKENLSNYRKDTLILISKNDETVRFYSGQYVYDHISSHNKELMKLEKSRHTILDEKEEIQVINKIKDFIQTERG